MRRGKREKNGRHWFKKKRKTIKINENDVKTNMNCLEKNERGTHLGKKERKFKFNFIQVENSWLCRFDS